MLAKIFVDELKLKIRIGCTAEERAQPQDLLVSVSAVADISLAIQSDNLADTIDYCELQNAAVALSQSSAYSLLEKFVADLADNYLRNPLILKVTVRAEKPNKLPGSKSVGIEIEKSRE